MHHAICTHEYAPAQEIIISIPTGRVTARNVLEVLSSAVALSISTVPAG